MLENEQEENNLEENSEEQPGKEPIPRKSFKAYLTWKYLRWIPVGLVALFIFYLFMNYLVMPFYTKHGEAFEMPYVTYISFKEAEKILSDAGFRPILYTLIYSMTVPDSHVISQNPQPGVIVKSNRRTYLTVSRGEKWIRAPKLVGISERAAEVRIRRYDLVLGDVHFDFSFIHPKGVVSEQSIPVGDSVMVGDTIHIQISLGKTPDYLTVPNLIGKSFEEAKNILLESGFLLGLITYQTSDDLLPNTVIQQAPLAESVVDVGTTIDLTLSQIEENIEDNSAFK